MGVIEFLGFVTHPSMYVIYALVAVCLGLVLLVWFRGRYEKPEASSGVDAESMEALKEAMKAAAQQAAVVPEAGGAVTTQTVTVDPNPELENKIDQLNSTVKLKDDEIEGLKAQLGAAQSAQPAEGGGDTSALTGKINELEARLKEYEIIEEDIADLSHYKEKSEQLEQEVEDLKKQLAAGGGAVASPAPAAAEAAAEPAVDEQGETVDDNIMAEFAAAVEEQDEPPDLGGAGPKAADAPEAEVEAEAAPPVEDPQEKAERIMREAAASVDEPTEPAEAEPEVIAEPEVAVAPEVVAAPEPVAEPEPEPAAVEAVAEPAAEEKPAPAAPVAADDDDIMAEFAAATDESFETPSPDVSTQVPDPEGATDNLFDEFSDEHPDPAAEPVVAAESAEEPAAVAAGDGEEDAAEDANFDLDKMMEEASGLEASGEDINAEEAIGTELDTDKLLAEANDIGSNDTEELMEKFEEKVEGADG